MLKNERFDELLLFTTTCFDAGVNIHDDDLHDIVIDVGLDIGQIVQCIGRKRLNGHDDYVNVHIKSITNKQLGGKETQLKKKVEMADYFRMYGANSYVTKYYREVDRNHIVYDHPLAFGYEKRLNHLMYFNVRNTLAQIDMMKFFGEWGFCKYVADYFGIKNYYIVEDEMVKDSLEVYLERLSTPVNGEKLRLFKSEREELIQMIGLKDAHRKLQKSITQLNAYFESNDIKYRIISDTDNRRKLIDGSVNPNRKKVYWEILN